MAGLAALLADLTGGDDQRAETAASRLPRFGAAGFEALTGLRRSERADTRWWAVRALAGWPPSGPLTRELLAALQDDSDDVRQCAALALAGHPDPQAVLPLIGLLSASDPFTARLAANALVRIGAPAVPALIEFLQSGPHPARLEALRALAEIKDPRAIPLLMKLLGEDSTLMQYWAGHGLDKAGLGMIYLEPH